MTALRVLRVCSAFCSAYNPTVFCAVARVARFFLSIGTVFGCVCGNAGGAYIGKNALQRATRYKLSPERYCS